MDESAAAYFVHSNLINFDVNSLKNVVCAISVSDTTKTKSRELILRRKIEIDV